MKIEILNKRVYVVLNILFMGFRQCVCTYTMGSWEKEELPRILVYDKIKDMSEI